MTTGRRILDGSFNQLVQLTSQVVPVTIGPYVDKTWSGGNSASTKKMILARPIRVSTPSTPPIRPKVIRLNSETSAQFRARERAIIANWRRERADFFARLESQNRYRRSENEKARAARRREKRLKRSMSPNSYDMSVQRLWRCAYKFSSVAQPDNFQWATNGISGTLDHLPLSVSDHYDVIEKLHRRAFGSGFHPGVFAAEFSQTCSLIGNAARQLSRLLIAVKRRDWRSVVMQIGRPTDLRSRGARTSSSGFYDTNRDFVQYLDVTARKDIASAWLAIQYGWKPLLGDLEEGAAYLAQSIYNPANAKWNNRISARKMFEKTAKLDPGYGSVGFRDKVTKHTVQYVVTGLNCASPGTPPSLASVASVVWEKVSYSFIVDWVAPIGAYLAACRTSALIKGTVVTTICSETTWNNVGFSGGVGRLIPLSVGPTTRRFYTLKRTVSSEISVPTPLGDLSPTSIFSSWQRAVNAVALLQNLKGLK